MNGQIYGIIYHIKQRGRRKIKMRKISRLAFFLALSVISVIASALCCGAENEEDRRYLISQSEERYSIFLYEGGAPGLIAESDSLSELVALADDGAEIVFDGIASADGVRLCGGRNIKISGSLSFTGDGGLTLDEESVVISDLSLNFEYGALNIRGGRVTFESGTIVSLGTAIRQEYADASAFYMLGGSVMSRSDCPSFVIERGTARLLGGSLTCGGEYAAECRASLYVSPKFTFSSALYGIYTERAISLVGSNFEGGLCIKYGGVFEKGTMSEVLLGACAEDVGAFRVFDVNSKEHELKFFASSEFSEEKNFIAVFEPFNVKFKHGGTTLIEVEAARGSFVSEPTANEVTGFTFCGWYYNEQLTERCLFDAPIDSDVTLYAAYALDAPKFGISSKSVTYDAGAHKFSLDLVSHPLEASGSYYFEWMKDGEFFSSGEEITLYNVIDSGEYCCKISFNYLQYSVSVITPSVSFSVNRAQVRVPTVYPKTYSATRLVPDILPSALYTAECDGGVDAGIYPVVLTLCDSDNYQWSVGTADAICLDFEIVKAENRFVHEINVFDVYFLAESTFMASALFGSVRAEYRDADGVLLSRLPTECGNYFVTALVDETENYYGLRSEPLPFAILEERAVGLSAVIMPSKTEYRAFEKFNPNGLCVQVSFNSGRSEEIGADKLTVSYSDGECFRYGDTAVTVSYLDASVYIPVTVEKASYALDADIFGDAVREYSGFYISPRFVAELPTGLDGIPLCARIEGGGTDVGTYPIRLIFYSESRDYEIPADMYASLTVTEKRVALVWGDTRFVYNGKRQCPSAGFTDAYGVFKSVDVTGGEYIAGDGYVARASAVANYGFENPETEFVIEKADYDLCGIFWSDCEFVYSGEVRTVLLCGLPSGVRVSGYADNSAEAAGEYTARVTLTYDALNYNEPTVAPFVWRIVPAHYDMSGAVFEDAEFVFDGETHYPILNGVMPTGADGSSPRYGFSTGARRVCDGLTEVVITFYTDSENYIAPDPITRSVRISPTPISVVWNYISFTYDACAHAPVASSDKCTVTVTGGATDAGRYAAYAIADNSDYFILNAEIDFEIKKAENRFLSPPCADDIFEGDELICRAEALFGDAVFLFYRDAALTEQISAPTSFGVYYAVATVEEGRNYSALFSAPIKFTVVRVIPTELYIVLLKSEYTAFEVAKHGDFEAYLIYNNGGRRAVSPSEVNVKYARGESFRAGDDGVDFICGDLTAHVNIEVGRAAYDMSGVEWRDLCHVYDGEKKHVTLAGLPESVTLIAIEGGEGIHVGEYAAHAVLKYDADNYECPTVPDAYLVIEPAVVPIPIFGDAVYDGTCRRPLETSEIWSADLTDGARDVGEYELTVTLTDARNYIFSDGSTSVTSVFRIIPRELHVSVPDVMLYLGEKYEDPPVEIIGEVAEGDDLGLAYVLSDGRVGVTSSNPNYRLTVEGGEVVRSYLPSPRVRGIAYITLLSLFALVLILTALRSRRRKVRLASLGAASTAVQQKKRTEPTCDVSDEDQKDKEPCDESDINIELRHFSTPMDAERADALISNSLAKDLIGTGEECILTSGRRKSVINIDTLSESFSAGERVDVNILKSMNLVPYDTAYIKVLARGMIDKPLFVYANDFSSTAVKMLALTGGRAIRVSTVKYKEPADNGTGKERRMNDFGI